MCVWIARYVSARNSQSDTPVIRDGDLDELSRGRSGLGLGQICACDFVVLVFFLRLCVSALDRLCETCFMTFHISVPVDIGYQFRIIKPEKNNRTSKTQKYLFIL